MGSGVNFFSTYNRDRALGFGCRRGVAGTYDSYGRVGTTTREFGAWRRAGSISANDVMVNHALQRGKYP